MNKIYKENVVVAETIISAVSDLIHRMYGSDGSMEATRQMVAASLLKQLSPHVIVVN